MPINVVGSERSKRKADLKADGVLEQLKDATPAQINTYIDNNVTDLASAKEFLKKLTRLCVYLLKRVDENGS